MGEGGGRRGGSRTCKSSRQKVKNLFEPQSSQISRWLMSESNHSLALPTQIPPLPICYRLKENKEGRSTALKMKMPFSERYSYRCSLSCW